MRCNLLSQSGRFLLIGALLLCFVLAERARGQESGNRAKQGFDERMEQMARDLAELGPIGSKSIHDDPETERAILDAINNQRCVFLGINGELYRQPPQASGFNSISMLIVKNGEGYTFLSGYDHAPCGGVDAKGNVTLTKRARGLHSTARAIRKWPKNDSGKSLNMHTWEFLEEASGKSISHVAPPNAVGWGVLLVDGEFYMPAQDMKKPENIVWIVEGPERSFSIVHSGPLHDGTLITVKRGKVEDPYPITFGAGSEGLFPIPSEPRFWALRVWDADKESIITPTMSVTIYGAMDASERMMFRDGSFYGISKTVQ